MTGLRWIAAALCGISLSAGAEGPPAGWTPVPDKALAATRGGFDSGSGMLVSLGIERLVAVNGATVASSQFSIADVARVTAGEARQALPALLIQNSVNDQLIRSQTTINASVSGLSILRDINFETSMRAALSGALAPR